MHARRFAPEAKRSTTRIPWDQLQEVRVIQTAAISKNGWLMAWPRQVPMQLPNRMYHPEWKAAHSAVKVCDLDHFKDQVDAVRAAVRRGAGAAWNESALSLIHI